MSDVTTNLEMPFILPAQAQKHVTHNEALQQLDAVTQLSFVDMLAQPPEEPNEGECYVVLPDATDAWSGRDGKIACFQDGAWRFSTPKSGWIAFDHAEEKPKVFRNGTWSEFSLPDSAEFSTVGVSATADDYNRLAISAPASLFNHAGNGHQLKINKNSITDTATLLYQTNWSGRAEFGLAGNDDFSIKVSADGSNWETALTTLPGGLVDFPNRPAVRTSKTAGSASPADGSQTGFNTLSVTQGGFALGAAVPSGTGNRLIIPADGLYLLSLTLAVNTSTSHGVAVLANGSTSLAQISGHNSGGPRSHQTVTTLAQLAKDDWLCLQHTGNASLEFGPGYTEITLLRL